MERNGLEELSSRSVVISVEVGPHLLNRHRANGTYDDEMSKLEIRNKEW